MSAHPCPATPVLAVCGWSGAGKTTLIESLLPRLHAEGLAVGVWKRDAHQLDIDRAGKDTDRFYRAGAASILGEDAGQWFFRSRKNSEGDFLNHFKKVPLDLLVVEGHKASPFPKIWIEGPPGFEPPPSHLENCLKGFPRSDTMLNEVFEFLLSFLAEAWRRRKVRTAVLVGGQSQRMGRPKTLLEIEGSKLLERIVHRIGGDSGADITFSGTGPIPDSLMNRFCVLPDVEGGASPLAGIVSLLRWDPHSAWIVVGCDLPDMSLEFVDWLTSSRSPGNWAIVPHLAGEDRLEPLAALYEPQFGPKLEAAWEQGERSLQEVLRRARIDSPVVPRNLESCLRNINTPEDWENYVSKSHRVSEQP